MDNEETCKKVCDVLKSRSGLIAQQKKDLLNEIKGGKCNQGIINKSTELDSQNDMISNIVINLGTKNICKCYF